MSISDLAGVFAGPYLLPTWQFHRRGRPSPRTRLYPCVSRSTVTKSFPTRKADLSPTSVCARVRARRLRTSPPPSLIGTRGRPCPAALTVPRPRSASSWMSRTALSIWRTPSISSSLTSSSASSWLLPVLQWRPHRGTRTRRLVQARDSSPRAPPSRLPRRHQGRRVSESSFEPPPRHLTVIS